MVLSPLDLNVQQPELLLADVGLLGGQRLAGVGVDEMFQKSHVPEQLGWSRMTPR